eukprot:scaffold25333_cov64-Phaeocystis_antarctica.AAC.2
MVHRTVHRTAHHQDRLFRPRRRDRAEDAADARRQQLEHVEELVAQRVDGAAEGVVRAVQGPSRREQRQQHAVPQPEQRHEDREVHAQRGEELEAGPLAVRAAAAGLAVVADLVHVVAGPHRVGHDASEQREERAAAVGLPDGQLKLLLSDGHEADDVRGLRVVFEGEEHGLGPSLRLRV